VDGNNLNDGETFTISDGQSGTVIFEFDTNNNGVGAGHVMLLVSSLDTASKVASSILNAINSQGLAITASKLSGSAVVTLTNNYEGAFGNQPILETVQISGFVVVGMSGGRGYDCASGTACNSDADCLIGLTCDAGSKTCQ